MNEEGLPGPAVGVKAEAPDRIAPFQGLPPSAASQCESVIREPLITAKGEHVWVVKCSNAIHRDRKIQHNGPRRDVLVVTPSHRGHPDHP